MKFSINNDHTMQGHDPWASVMEEMETLSYLLPKRALYDDVQRFAGFDSFKRSTYLETFFDFDMARLFFQNKTMRMDQQSFDTNNEFRVYYIVRFRGKDFNIKLLTNYFEKIAIDLGNSSFRRK
ncbi:hypothetical protein CR513_46982, partial [Mucuna pruriens]